MYVRFAASKVKMVNLTPKATFQPVPPLPGSSLIGLFIAIGMPY